MSLPAFALQGRKFETCISHQNCFNFKGLSRSRQASLVCAAYRAGSAWANWQVLYYVACFPAFICGHEFETHHFHRSSIKACIFGLQAFFIYIARQ